VNLTVKSSRGYVKLFFRNRNFLKLNLFNSLSIVVKYCPYLPIINQYFVPKRNTRQIFCKFYFSFHVVLTFQVLNINRCIFGLVINMDMYYIKNLLILVCPQSHNTSMCVLRIIINVDCFKLHFT